MIFEILLCAHVKLRTKLHQNARFYAGFGDICPKMRPLSVRRGEVDALHLGGILRLRAVRLADDVGLEFEL